MTAQQLYEALVQIPPNAILERNAVGNLSIIIDGKWAGWINLAPVTWGEPRIQWDKEEESA